KEYKDIQKSRRNKTEDEKTLKQRIKELAKKIRNILEPVLIRRSRIDLKVIDDYRNDLKKQGIDIPIVALPILQEYELSDLANLYLKTLEKICSEDKRTGFIGARYNPANYLKDFNDFKAKMKNQIDDIDSIRIAQTNLAIFMRRLLVGRFESSVEAFKSTLHSMISSMETIKDYYERLSKIPIYKKGMLPDVDILLQNYDDEDIEDLNELSFEKELKSYYDKGLIFINRDEIKNEFIIDLNHDIELLKSIENEWFKNGIKKDPKLEHFIEEIKTQISKEPKRKIVVFSQYRDTVDYLYENVRNDLRTISYSSESSNKIKRIIRENFDATNKVQKDDFDLIIATDALSEGVNLNKAGTVFNYDIPYNPTRVIQRVGRINRISKKVFDKLYIYNYFPTHIGEAETRTREISTLKKAMIDALLGEDTKYLTSEEELQSYFTKKYKEEMELYEQKSWDVEYRNFYLNLKKSKPELIEKAKEIPHRARIRRTTKKDKKGVLVFGKKGNDYTFQLGLESDNVFALTVPEALHIFEAEITEKPKKITIEFENLYQNAKAKMFITKTQIKLSGRKGQAIHKIEVIKELFPDKKDYFMDLLFVAKELNSLPEGVYKQIRNIDEKTLRTDIDNLMRIVPHYYLSKIIQTANKIDEGKETLILAEELI
ncbi:MAG: helicase, partial [Candidatus Cloacimonetes bacterium]|nr:helicase [Candidatus Cloacimonadota bacterium]